MTENKTRPTDVSVARFLAAVEPADKRTDALALDALFQRVTGFQPRMWGPAIVGYGSYAYTYDSGHSGTAPAVGFSPRKAAHSIYAGLGDQSAAMLPVRLGKYKIGKSCLYVKRLSDIDPSILAELIGLTLTRLNGKWGVSPT